MNKLCSKPQAKKSSQFITEFTTVQYSLNVPVNQEKERNPGLGLESPQIGGAQTYPAQPGCFQIRPMDSFAITIAVV